MRAPYFDFRDHCCTEHHRRSIHRKALTLIELLAVFSIVGMLLSIVLPAVQAAREASRLTSCKNNLKQIGVAALQHEAVHRHFPSGGWGWRWAGDPDRGFGRQQPGSWLYNLLPYIEENSLREYSRGKPDDVKRLVGKSLMETELPTAHCPGRPSEAASPYQHADGFVNIERPHFVARSDYAANVGDRLPLLYGPGPVSLLEGDDPKYPWTQLDRTGIVFRRSQIRSADVEDGLSNTYLAAESYLNPGDYSSGNAGNNNNGMFAGYDRDTLRVTHVNFPPVQDKIGLNRDHCFGSAHPDGFQAVLCDGSVRLLTYRLSPEIHRRLGNRHDHQSVEY